jgi:alpha-ketoglutaric semialdehyde dehydrogenase
MKSANFIGGAWRPSVTGRTEARVNPFRPSETAGQFPQSDSEDVDAAVRAASDAARLWRSTPGPQRGAVLYRAAEVLRELSDQIVHSMALEVGKPVREALGEVQRSVELLRFFAGEGWRPVGEVFDQSARAGTISVLHRPVGVVGLLTPWNFPLSIPTWKAAPALIYGNTVVLKTAGEAPSAALYLASALQTAGLPDGVFNIVVGDSEAGAALVEHPQVRALSFTGSDVVGQQVLQRAAPRRCKLQLEMGGHSPLLVDRDANLERAAEAAVSGAYWSAGQKCTSTRRIYVSDSIYHPFREALLARMDRLVCGDPLDSKTEVGPLAGSRQLESVMDGIGRALGEGARLSAGGNTRQDFGYFVQPTLFEDVSEDGFLSRHEVFGPVCSLYSCWDMDEAIERANSSPYGLSASIFTGDARTSARASTELQAGVIRINSPTTGGEPHVAFGGLKSSGYGPREQGRAAREFFTETVTVYEATEV